MMTSARLVCAAALVLGACQPVRNDDEQVPKDLVQYVLESTPEFDHSTFVDFGGKVHLLGYDLEPDGVASPGARLKLTLYWKCVGDLDEGWGLFTHLFDARGRRIGNFDNDGPLRTWQDAAKRQALPPGLWQPGSIYVDEQTITIPRGEDVHGTLTLVTGVWHAGMRLSVLSGPTDGQHAGIVTHLDTGVAPPRSARLAPAAEK